MTEAPIAAESGHWYKRDGSPCYEVSRANGDGMRAATLADARRLDLVPSVTTILRCAAAPGLEAWKTRQVLMSALTLPRIDGETADGYATRVIKDSKEQGKKAAERGTELHAEIESFIQTNTHSLKWMVHIVAIRETLDHYGIDLLKGKAEHSFACGAGFGGKVDWHDDALLLDFKSKDRIDAKVKPYNDHLMQCAAYAYGLGVKRAGNVFIGVEDKQVRVFLYEPEQLAEAFGQFTCLLSFWQRKNKFGIYDRKKHGAFLTSYDLAEMNRQYPVNPDVK